MPGTFAACCLNARRLAERGVRNIQIFHRGWDAHGNLPKEHESQCKDVDRGCAALIKDLKRLGMLGETLVIWGGEFGRTAYCQGGLTKANYGRDHHPRCFTVWMAGGGVKAGITYGQTDDYGYNIAEADGTPMKPQPTKADWTPGHDAYSRPECNDPAPAGNRPQAVDLSLPRSRLSPDRRPWPRHPRLDRMTALPRTDAAAFDCDDFTIDQP